MGDATKLAIAVFLISCSSGGCVEVVRVEDFFPSLFLLQIAMHSSPVVVVVFFSKNARHSLGWVGNKKKKKRKRSHLNRS